MQVTDRFLDELIPYPNNPRDNDKAVQAVADSIQAFGFQQPIVVDVNGVIIAGHTRYKAAKKLGLQKVPVVVASDLTPDEVQAYRLADNKSGEKATWITDKLNIELKGIELDMSPWFAQQDLSFATHDGADELPDEETVECRAKRGEVWQLGRHRVMCGDSTSADDTAELFGGCQPYAIITDPPYCSGGFQEAGKKAGSIGTRDTLMIANDTLLTRGYILLIKTVLEKAGDTAMAYIFTDWRMFVNLFDAVEASGYGVRNMIVWDKVTPGMGVGWRSQHEIVLFASRAAQKFNPHLAQGNVIQCARTGNVNHPTEKPVELLRKIMRVTDMAETIYDPFGGSGTTLMAAEEMGRTCYVMELEPHYVDVIITRWETLTGGKAEKVKRNA